MAEPPAASLDGPTMPNPVLEPAPDATGTHSFAERVAGERLLALREERDALKLKLQALRAQAASPAPDGEPASTPESPATVETQRELVLLRERTKTLLASLKEEQGKAKQAAARSEELGAHCRELEETQSAQAAAVDALRKELAQAETQRAPQPTTNEARAPQPTAPGHWAAARIEALVAGRTAEREKVQRLRARLAHVDEERQHLSAEIQRLVDERHAD